MTVLFLMDISLLYAIFELLIDRMYNVIKNNSDLFSEQVTTANFKSWIIISQNFQQKTFH